MHGTWLDLGLAAPLGALVGGLVLRFDTLPATFKVILPIGAAFVVAAIVFLVGGATPEAGVFAPLVAPLVSLLPGALLTTAVIHLVTGQMMSGAGRLAAGVMQIVLLAVGIIAAGEVVGVPKIAVSAPISTPVSAVAPWVGVAVFGIGVVLACSHGLARWAGSC